MQHMLLINYLCKRNMRSLCTSFLVSLLLGSVHNSGFVAGAGGRQAAKLKTQHHPTSSAGQVVVIGTAERTFPSALHLHAEATAFFLSQSHGVLLAVGRK
jgi:hypothetical protein